LAKEAYENKLRSPAQMEKVLKKYKKRITVGISCIDFVG